MTQEYGIRIVFENKAGRYVITSHDMPELLVSHSESAVALADVLPTIEFLYKTNRGEDVVALVQPAGSNDSFAEMPALPLGEHRVVLKPMDITFF